MGGTGLIELRDSESRSDAFFRLESFSLRTRALVNLQLHLSRTHGVRPFKAAVSQTSRSVALETARLAGLNATPLQTRKSGLPDLP